MRSLWFGGSFNPVHHAHLICARAVAESAGFDRVILLPSAQPPHKSKDTNMASHEHRLAMCRLAISGDPLFEVDDLELNRPGPSYTIDTARELRARGHQEINWLIGADQAPTLPTWHSPTALLAEVKFILMARPGNPLDWGEMSQTIQPLKNNLVNAPLIDISSTVIRRRISAGLSIRYLTPPAVIDYIEAHQLYRHR